MRLATCQHARVDALRFLLVASCLRIVSSDVTSMSPTEAYVDVPLNLYIQGSSLCGRAGDALSSPTGTCTVGDTLLFTTEDTAGCVGASTVSFVGFGHFTNGGRFLNPSNLIFTAPGYYHVCFKCEHCGYTSLTKLDSSIFFVRVIGATSFSPTSIAKSTATTFTFVGEGLDATSGADQVKVVAATDGCDGTIVASDTNLGPDEAANVNETTAQITVATGGTYKFCYKAGASSIFSQMSQILYVAGVQSFGTTVSAIGVQAIIVFIGSSLSRYPGTGDAVKFVDDTVTTDAGCVSAPAAAGTGTEQTDLHPDDAINQQSTQAVVTFTIGGTYQACYKLATGDYELLSSSQGTITINGASNITQENPPMMTGVLEVFTITGLGMDSTSGGDSVKFVSSSTTCDAPLAGDPSEVTDLGPGDATGQTSVTASVTFTYPGSYQMCYKVKNEVYVKFSDVFEITTPEPTAAPTSIPTIAPTSSPTAAPTESPTATPTTAAPTVPTPVPTSDPTYDWETSHPTLTPTSLPTEAPTEKPTSLPTVFPTASPTSLPTEAPTSIPTSLPTEAPTSIPSEAPTSSPTSLPTRRPTDFGETWAPTDSPTQAPTSQPTLAPTFPSGTQLHPAYGPYNVGDMHIYVLNWFGMNVGNVLAITGTGPSAGLGENVIIAGFGEEVSGNWTYSPTSAGNGSRRLHREDYEEDDMFTADGRRLDQAEGAGKILLTSMLLNKYEEADVLVISVDAASVVGADPITRYGSVNVKFWLPNFQLVPLLRTEYLSLYASTFPGPSNDLQWFERFVLTSATESPIVKVSIKKNLNLTRTLPPRVFSQLDVTLKDAEQPLKTMAAIHSSKNGREIWQDYATETGLVQLRIGRQEHSPPRLHSRSYEYVYIQSPDLEFAIVPAHAAVEFRSEWFMNNRSAAYEHAHVDMMIMHMQGEKNFGGILPELWGLRPMSDEVRAMTVAPSGEGLKNESDEVLVCDGGCELPQLPILDI